MAITSPPNQAELRVWQFALDSRPDIPDEPLHPIFIWLEVTVSDKADPRMPWIGLRTGFQRVGTIRNDMNPLRRTKKATITFATDGQDIKPLREDALASTPNPASSVMD